MQQKHIAILDFGSQYTHLIARRIRQLGVFAKIYPPEVKREKLKNVWGIILSGGPNSVYDEKIKFDREILKTKSPVLGICYGLQLMTYVLGGKVERGTIREYGLAKLEQKSKTILFQGWSKKEPVWMSHGDQVTRLPQGFTVLASTKDCLVSAMARPSQKLYGVQFHPEVTHTKNGLVLLKNFLFKICGAKKEWNLTYYLESLGKEVLQKVGKRKVFLLVSGGVDSAVCFGLLNRIFGKERVFGLHIDTGFMRKNESQLIKKQFSRLGFSNLTVIRTNLFYQRLKGIIDPERKRKIIGKTYLDVQKQALKKFHLNPREWILAQGTIYPDTIESGSTKHADKIKTHHNRVKAIQTLITKGLIIEPLKDLYKDEVRQLGRRIGLPSEIIDRHPFPGPGLAIRVLCSRGEKDKQKRQRLEQALDQVLSRFNAAHRSSLKGWMLPIKSVGVQGDERTYAHPAVIDGDCPPKLLALLSPTIGNEVKGINRVLKVIYKRKNDLGKGKLIKLLLTKQVVHLLQEIDAIVNEEVKKANLEKKIWQFPVVIAPFSLTHGLTVILRPVESKEAMTVSFFKLPNLFLKRIVNRLSRFSQIDLILYDLTNKPPATIEWE